MKPSIKRGTAARLGLRGPGPRFILTFPKDVSPEVVERFIAEWEATRSHPLFVDLSPTEPEPRPTWVSRALRKLFRRSR